MPNIRMTLLQNSITFFEESLVKAIQAETKENSWKFAILLLVQAIETSLKERLRMTQDVLVYTNIDKPKHTVDLGLAIDRLKRISKVEFQESDVLSIKTAAELRNQVVHFEFDLPVEQIKSNYIRLVGFYTSFCHDQLKIDIVSGLNADLRSELMSLESYIHELEQRALDRIEREGIDSDFVWMCPACLHDTFVIEDYKDICYLCAHEEPVVQCAGCSEFEFEYDLKDVDFGNMKGIENWKKLCRVCIDKLENEEPDYDYY